MPAITCWSRSSECSGRGDVEQLAAAAGGSGHASGPSAVERLVRLERRRASAASPTRACLVPNSRSRSSRPPGSRSSTRDVCRAASARLSNSCSRPALIRCTSSVSGRAPVGSSISSLPRRRTPVNAAPSSALQRRVERLERVDAGRQRRLDRLRPASAAASRRAVISISGSSGTTVHASLLPVDGPVGQARRRRRSRARAERELEALVGGLLALAATCTAPRSAPRVCAALLPDEADDRARPVLLPRPRARTCSPRLHGHRHAAGAAARPRRHGRRARRAPAARARRRAARRLAAAVDMKGGVVLAHRRAARARRSARRTTPRSRCCSSATRSGARRRSPTSTRFAGFDACLCFEARRAHADGDEGVVVRRKAAGHDPRHAPTGAPRTRGSAPDRGRNALLALAAAAQAVAARHDPARRRTA